MGGTGGRHRLEGAPDEAIAFGGFQSRARSATVQLALGDTTWDAPVWFFDPWPLAFHLLGQGGFFKRFGVTIRAARYSIEVAPEGG